MKTNRPNTRTERQDSEMATAILDKAHELFIQFGIRRTSMEDIAAAMGKRKSFLYYYFPGKAEVLRSLTQREFSRMAAAIRVAVERVKHPEERLRAYIRERAVQLTERVQEVRRSHLTIATSEDLVELLQINEFREQFDQAEHVFLKSILQQGVAGGQFRALPDSELESFCAFSMASLRGSELDMMLDPERSAHYVERSELMVDLMLDGFRPR